MGITLERLKEIIDSQFSTPFLPNGTVSAKFVEETKEKTLEIKIGCRDVWLNENGEITGAGTDVSYQPETC